MVTYILMQRLRFPAPDGQVTSQKRLKLSQVCAQCGRMIVGGISVNSRFRAPHALVIARSRILQQLHLKIPVLLAVTPQPLHK